MTFLPKEFGGAEEHTGTHFPTEYVGPLVAKNREVAIRLNPVFICVPDDCFGCRTNNKFLFEASFGIDNHAIAVRVVFQTIMSNYSAFLCKAFNVVGFAAEERFRNQEWEISVNVASGLKHIVELTLHFLPDSVTIRFDDHTPTHGRLLGQIGFNHEFVVPLRIVF